MARTIFAHIDPFSGLGYSTRTSNVLDMRDVFDLSFSYYTIAAGAARAHTLQLSNANNIEAIPEASWSDWTSFTPAVPSGATIKFPPLGFRYARFTRAASGTTTVIDVNKLVR
jgi:hypothetical protein